MLLFAVKQKVVFLMTYDNLFEILRNFDENILRFDRFVFFLMVDIDANDIIASDFAEVD
jgi:hypothetical protein